MKNKIIYLLLTSSILISFSSCGQSKVKTSVKIPKEFKETDPPKYGSKEWYKLNYSDKDFEVKIIDGELKIEKTEEDTECELNVPNGKIKGIDRGEWGGILKFVPSDTTKSSVEIKRGNVKIIFTFKDKIYFIEGLAHLNHSSGALYELDTTDNKFLVNKLVDFDDAPAAFTIFEDKFLIVTHKNFYIVKDFKKELIFEDAFWNSLYPNSIGVIDEENVFVGIRGGIVKIDLNTKTFKFYKNDK